MSDGVPHDIADEFDVILRAYEMQNAALAEVANDVRLVSGDASASSRREFRRSSARVEPFGD